MGAQAGAGEGIRAEQEKQAQEELKNVWDPKKPTPREMPEDARRIYFSPDGTTRPRWAMRRSWAKGWRDKLYLGKFDECLRALKRLKPKSDDAKECVRKTIHYYDGNRQRMRYAEFRAQGYFIGSGVRGRAKISSQAILKDSPLLRGAERRPSLPCIRLRPPSGSIALYTSFLLLELLLGIDTEHKIPDAL